MASSATASSATARGPERGQERAPATERLTEHANVLSWDCGMSNLAYCLLEDQDDPEREHAVRLWENFSLRADSMAEAIASLRRELDARPWMLLADNVVIEAQVAANPQMKVIAHALQMYFLARRAPGTPQNVHFVCPKSKFKVCNVPDPEGARGHAKNKKIAVLMAQKMLAREKASLDYLNSHRKKDDLADSYLQAVYFMRTLKARKRTAASILAHIAPGTAAAQDGAARAITIDESDDERPHQRLYRCEDFALRAEFCIDAASVERGTRFAKPLPI